MVALFWSLQDAGAEGEALLPKDSDIPGWRMIDQPYHYGPADLWKYINGEAEFYIAYGFVSLAGANYTPQSADVYSLGVDVFDMEDKLNAFGVFQSKRGKEPSSLKIGAASFGAGGYVVFYKDRYYVEVLSFGKARKGKEGHLLMARKVAEKIKGDNTPPQELRYLPESGRVAGSERYVKGGILGHAFWDRGLTADYRVDGDSVSAFVVLFPSMKKASEALQKHRDFLRESGATWIPLSGCEKHGYASQEPHHKEILVMEKGPFLVGVYDLSKAEKGMALLREMTERVKIPD
jgi:hypothetical protein